MTINKAIDIDQYPLPRPTDLFATFTNGKYFTKLDLSQAYQQMRLEETSAQYHASRIVSLPFGVAMASASHR